ncbi:MAG: hypothetical protein HYY93_05060 [Planctomycetes bacterium]|nr:hypothetical protein [Planctomycetota bacterium]
MPSPAKTALIEFQVARLQKTYEDFGRDPQHRLIADYFFRRVYSTTDKAERDLQFKKIYEAFRSALGPAIVEELGKLIRANELTDELDDRCLLELEKLGWRHPKPLTMPVYEAAYRAGDNYDRRVEQIRLLAETVEFFHGLSRWAAVGMVLKGVKLLARAKGASAFLQFIEDGYDAFRSVDDIAAFRKAMEERELEILNRIYGRAESRRGRRGARGKT